jgi:hypothetical protein
MGEELPPIPGAAVRAAAARIRCQPAAVGTTLLTEMARAAASRARLGRVRPTPVPIR